MENEGTAVPPAAQKPSQTTHPEAAGTPKRVLLRPAAKTIDNFLDNISRLAEQDADATRLGELGRQLLLAGRNGDLVAAVHRSGRLITVDQDALPAVGQLDCPITHPLGIAQSVANNDKIGSQTVS